MTAEQVAELTALAEARKADPNYPAAPVIARLLEERKRLLEALKQCCSDLESMDRSITVPSEHRAAIAFAEEAAP